MRHCASVRPRIIGVNDNFPGLVFKTSLFLYALGNLKDQPYGVVQRRGALNRVKALLALTLLCQKTKPKGLFCGGGLWWIDLSAYTNGYMRTILRDQP